MTSYNKLVRDKIPEILDKKGVSYEKRIADGFEYKNELLKKLKEEIEEFISSKGDVEELADIEEVLLAIKKLPEYTDLENARVKKVAEKGAFEQKIILKGEK